MKQAIDHVIPAVKRERIYQDAKHGRAHHHELPSWMLIMRRKLEEAEAAWYRGEKACLRHLLEAVATGVAAMEVHGVVERFYESDLTKLKSPDPHAYGRAMYAIMATRERAESAP